MRRPNHNQFLFPATTPPALPPMRVQHARMIANPTSGVRMPFDFSTVNKNDPFDFATINTGVSNTFRTSLKPTTTSTSEISFASSSSIITAVSEPTGTSTLPTSIMPGSSSTTTTPAPTHISGVAMPDPAWPKPTSSAAFPASTIHTDTGDIDAQNDMYDNHVAWITAAAVLTLTLIIVIAAIAVRSNGSRRWRREKSTRPVERMKMVLPSYQRGSVGSGDGLHAALGQPSTGSLRGHSGRYFGNDSAYMPAYPMRAHGNPYKNKRLEQEAGLTGGRK